MNNDIQHLEKADLVSDFIDCLNKEKKPKIDDENFEDLEMLEMFEAIRALKRLRVDEEFVEDKTKLEDTVPRRIIPIKKVAAAAAIFLVALISARSLNFPFTSTNNKPDDTMMKQESTENIASTKLPSTSMDKKTGEQMNTMVAADNRVTKKRSTESEAALKPSAPVEKESGDQISAMVAPDSTESGMRKKQNAKSSIALFANDNIVYAMEKAYEKITGYSGIIEVRSEDKNGKVDSLETIEIKYKKPNKYISVQKYGDQTVTRISDGTKLYTIDSGLVTVDYLSPEKEIWRFSIGKKIQDLKKAAEVKQVGEEVISGKETLVYEFMFSNNEPVNKIWIDKSTNLPLKQELNMPDGSKLTNQFMQVEINPEFNDSMFSYKLKEGQEVKYENKESSIDEVKKVWTYTDALIKNIPDTLKSMKVVKLDNPYEIYKYMIRFSSNDGEQYLDVYITSKYIENFYIPESQKGKLENGWIEMKNDEVNLFKVYIGRSNIVRWVTPEFDISAVSSLKAENIVEVLEKISGSKVILDSQN